MEILVRITSDDGAPRVAGWSVRSIVWVSLAGFVFWSAVVAGLRAVVA